MFEFIMGNEESHTSNVDFDKEAIEVTDNWTLYYARNFNGSNRVFSAFISPQGSSDSSSNSLKAFAKNLMIHRHPNIIQYVSSWSKNDSFYLVTEEVKPLSQVIGNQSALQICIGLHNILKALVFLHEKAQSSHNNLCCSSIYVTPEGVWKLGGLNYLKKFSDVTCSFLQESRAHRYEKAVPPEEDSLMMSPKINAEAIDAYAFGVLVEEVLKKKTDDEVPHLLDFKAFCKKTLHSTDPFQRYKLSEVMSHEFFSHDFIRIHKFLSELPLKLRQEKEEFFRDLTVQLSVLPEEIVASQLASLLLSRIVILDEAAQHHFVPVILHPKTGEGRESAALFHADTFKRHIVPKLLQMFCVRDAQIRLILLNHFRSFCNLFTTDQLKQQILPELLTGIKDVNDELVSTTLKALADLVLILGASTVVGGRRGKLFTDGRPKVHDSSVSRVTPSKRKEKTSPCKIIHTHSELPERLSPDGGEDDVTATTVEEPEVDTENWSDWDSPGEKEDVAENEVKFVGKETEIIHYNHQTLPDISTLDIKYNGPSAKGEIPKETEGSEIDFFRDMEPVIFTAESVNVNSNKNLFDIKIDSEEVGGEWDEGWELEDECDSLPKHD